MAEEREETWKRRPEGVGKSRRSVVPNQIIGTFFRYMASTRREEEYILRDVAVNEP